MSHEKEYECIYFFFLAFFQFSRQLKFFIEHALTSCSCQCELTWLHSCALYILKLKSSNAQVVNVTSLQRSNPSTGGRYSKRLLRLKHPESACCRNPSLLKLCSTFMRHVTFYCTYMCRVCFGHYFTIKMWLCLFIHVSAKLANYRKLQAPNTYYSPLPKHPKLFILKCKRHTASNNETNIWH